MATSAAVFTASSYPNGRRMFLNGVSLRGLIAVGSGTYLTNGLPITYGSGEPPSDLQNGFSIGFVHGQSGYVYTMDNVNQTLRIWVTGTAANDPLNELTNGAAVPAGVTGDTISAMLEFNRGGN